MTIANGGSTISFGTDAFGTYAVGLEISDDLGRTSRATSDVDVAPAKDALVVQMLWTKFQPNDDPSTFPRVELHLVGDKTPLPTLPSRLLPPMASRSVPWILVKGDCTLENEKPPAWCHGHSVGTTSIEEVAIDAFPQYRIGVHYVDDRYAGQPVLCVRTFRGTLASEWCDDKVRSEGNWWDVAHVDAQTGKTPVPPPAPPRRRLHGVRHPPADRRHRPPRRVGSAGFRPRPKRRATAPPAAGFRRAPWLRRLPRRSPPRRHALDHELHLRRPHVLEPTTWTLVATLVSWRTGPRSRRTHRARAPSARGRGSR